MRQMVETIPAEVFRTRIGAAKQAVGAESVLNEIYAIVQKNFSEI